MQDGNTAKDKNQESHAGRNFYCVQYWHFVYVVTDEAVF